MKYILSLILSLFLFNVALADPPANPVQWTKLNEIYVDTGQARLYGAGGIVPIPDCITTFCNAIYVQTHISGSGVEFGQQNINTPTILDFTKPPYNLPNDAKAAFLTGMVLITHGNKSESADIHLTVGAEGDPNFQCNAQNYYLAQTVETSIGSGQRSNAAFWTPLTNGKAKFCYWVSTSGKWPTNSAYGINFTLQAWGR